MGAVSRSVSTAVTIGPFPYACRAVAVCAAVQNADPLRWATYAAISSRSPTDQSDGPRIASWVAFLALVP
jgi:hypothetical protein